MPNNFFIYDAERLQQLAAEAIIKRGLQYFSERRVFDLEWTDGQISAQVEGSIPDEPYSVTLVRGQDDRMQANCSCPYDDAAVCKHCISVLYAYSDQFTFEENHLDSAVDQAIHERIKKGRNEVRIKQTSGETCFGIWQASSLHSSTHWEQTYQVHLRSLEQRQNFCTCPDLAVNRLGTCKHIEAVLHHLKKQRLAKTLQQTANPDSFIYLAWESATHAQIKVHRAKPMDEKLTNVLDTYFDQSNNFQGRLPENFSRLEDSIYGRTDIHMGEDAIRHVRTITQDAAREIRKQEITQTINSSSGILPGIRAKLFPYQVEGVAFLASRGRALLADDMGLGKTLQAIAAATWLAEHESVQRILIACPASLKHQWQREIKKFTEHQAQIIHGGPSMRQVQYKTRSLFVIVNYELVLRDLSVISTTLKPDLLILDEAQRIKNWQTKIASTIKLIPSKYAFILTGTPLENRLQDLYSLLQVVDARVLGPLWRCMLDFHITDERGKILGYRNLSELRRRIAPVMLRRDRSLVRDQLPERTEVRLDIPMTNVQQELHDSALSAAGRYANIAKRRPLTPNEQKRLLSALQQARMACNAAGLVDKVSQGSPKLDELTRLLEDLCLQSNRKAVVFSQWERMTAMVESRVKQMGLGCVRLHGGVPTNKRGELMDRFREDDSIQVFISTDAGGVGLNLQSASILINLDMPWNPAVLDQRIARVHRLGQQENVQVFLLIAENAYEEHVTKLVQSKRNLFDNVISSEASEDVVGVSKRMLETIIEDLADKTDNVVGSAAADPEATVEAESTAASSQVKASETESEESDMRIRRMIERIQSEFGARLERILGAGGGLLVVVSELDEQDEQKALEISDEVAVAVTTPAILTGLQRLGALPSEYKEVPISLDAIKTPEIHPLLKLAEEKINAADILIERQCMTGVMELLGSSLLSVTAVMAGLKQSSTAEAATLWIYSEALKKGLLTSDQASSITRTISLMHVSDVPDELVRQCLQDTRQFIAELSQTN